MYVLRRSKKGYHGCVRTTTDALRSLAHAEYYSTFALRTDHPEYGGIKMNEAIAAANDSFMKTFARSDGTGMAKLYTGDGRLFPTGSDVVSGTQAIGEFWQGVMDMGVATATLETVELDDHGDTAIEEGRFTLAGADGEVIDRGKYIVVWKNDGGTWKLHKDIWNSSQPAE